MSFLDEQYIFIHHKKKKQVAATSSAAHERLQIFKQLDSQSFYYTVIARSGNIPRKLLKTIQQEHQVQTSNTLTVNKDY